MPRNAFNIRIQFDELLKNEWTHVISLQDQEIEHFSTSEAHPYYFSYCGPPLGYSGILLLIQINFACLWILYKWNHMHGFFCIWLLSLNTKSVRFIRVVVEIVICLFSVLYSIPLYAYTLIYHNSFKPDPNDWYLASSQCFALERKRLILCIYYLCVPT